MYSFAKADGRPYYIATISGFWDGTERERFASDIRSIAAAPGQPPVICLIDGTDFPVQSQDTIVLLDELRTSLETLIEPVVVLPSALVRLQAGRIMGEQKDRLFKSVGEAKDYIEARLLAR